MPPPLLASQWIDNAPPGASPGDVVVATGNVFETQSGPAVGVFDLVATTTTVASATERRFVKIELAFNPDTVPFKAPIIAQATANKSSNFANVAVAQTSDIELMGSVTYPAGGGVVKDPIVLAVVGGSGALVGARGQCVITYDPATQVFTYTVTLLKF